MELPETDEQLMVRYQAGDQFAFSELYRRYHRRLYGYLTKGGLGALKDEIFQNTWMKLHRMRLRYDPKYKFSAWIFTIARSVTVDALRRENRHGRQRVPLEETEIASEGPENTKIPDIPWDKVSSGDKKVLEWRYLEEETFEKIASRLGWSEVNARQRISRALKKLRRSLGGKDS